MFTDFDAGSFKYDEYPEMSRLLLNETVCCNPTCICTSQDTVRLRFIFLSHVFFYVESTSPEGIILIYIQLLESPSHVNSREKKCCRVNLFI